jgi:hypothetical protein
VDGPSSVNDHQKILNENGVCHLELGLLGLVLHEEFFGSIS